MSKAKFKRGDVVEVTGVASGHAIPIGTTGAITLRQNGYYQNRFPNS